MDFCFDDDVFGSTKVASNKNGHVPEYSAKIIDSDTLLNDKTETLDLEELINNKKLKADLYYLNKNYNNALELYQSSLELTLKSATLNETLFQRELHESIARCQAYLGEYQNAQNTCYSLEEKSENFESYTNALNLTLKIITIPYHSNQLEAKALTLFRLLTLHPCHINLWIQITDLFNSNQTLNSKYIDYSSYCYDYVIEINRHGYVNKSEIIQKQKALQMNWINEFKLKKTKSLEVDIIIERLEKIDKLSDNEKVELAKSLKQEEDYINLWFK